MSAPRLCRAALIQQAPVYLNLAASVERACSLIHQAGQDGADIVAFPETWLPGYPVWLDIAPDIALWDHAPAQLLFRHMMEQSPGIDDGAIVALRSAAVEAGSYVVMGLQERAGGTLYNSMLFIDPRKGEYIVHRKLMPTFSERMVWGRGDGSTLDVMPTPFGALGGLICWEHWMPLARAAMHARGESLHVAQWPWAKELNHLASRHYAFEGTCFVLVTGAVVSVDDIIDSASAAGCPAPAMELLGQMRGTGDTLMRGGGAVIGPDGQYVQNPVYDDDATVIAEFDAGRVAEARLALDTDGHYSRPDVFELTVDTRRQRSVEFGG